jgi:hypothetical protein
LGQEIRTLDHSKPRLALLDTPLRKRHHSIPQEEDHGSLRHSPPERVGELARAEAAGAKSAKIGNEEMSDRVRWNPQLRSQGARRSIWLSLHLRGARS